MPMLPFLDRADVSLVCIGPHPRTLAPRIDFTLSTIPDDQAFFERWSGKARLVTDVYGSVSYGDDPLRALAYCSLLLEPGGICAAFTELERIGGLATWNRAIQFFRRELQVTMTLMAVPIVEDASQSFATALRIQATRQQAGQVTLHVLVARLHDEVGRPMPSNTIWESPDKTARIQRIEYR